MLKFIKHHMTSEQGIEIFPLIGFLIFFIFFFGLIVMVIRMKKSHIEMMSNIPLTDDPVEHRNNHQQ